MTTTIIHRTAQRSLFSQEESCVKSTSNGSVCCNGIAARNRVNNYLKTREGLWRLLALFPLETPVTEAICKAPEILSNVKKDKGGVNT